ncbi:MAG: hypothetical protein ACHREM_28680 [Polyangiales bacterium]
MATASSAPDDASEEDPPPLRAIETARARLASRALRKLVAAAWAHAHLDDDEILGELAARARDSALLPELRLRAHTASGIGTSLATASDLTTRTYATDTAQTLYEARLTWRLDRLVFAEEEVSLERLRLERIELRQRIAARVVDLFVAWLRARAKATDATTSVEREAARLLELEARATLDAYTDGAAGPLLSPLARGDVDP